MFAPPRRLRELQGVVAVPGTRANETCTIVPRDLWRAFRDVSLWVEALAIHEWSLLTERVSGTARGRAYELLTERPHNRLPLTWERNSVELLMREGAAFTCPWTAKRLDPTRYQLDHVVPIAIHPFHELWNSFPPIRTSTCTASATAFPAPPPLRPQRRTSRQATEADGSAELAKELADLLEVAEQLMAAEGLEPGDVKALRERRRRDRGGFERRLWLRWTES